VGQVSKSGPNPSSIEQLHVDKEITCKKQKTCGKTAPSKITTVVPSAGNASENSVSAPAMPKITNSQMVEVQKSNPSANPDLNKTTVQEKSTAIGNLSQSLYVAIQPKVVVQPIQPAQVVNFRPSVVGVAPSQIFVRNIPIYIGIPVGQPPAGASHVTCKTEPVTQLDKARVT